jgi:hypothetical protein
MKCQRWRDHRTSYRPAGETIQRCRYEVAAIDSDTEAKDFVQAHHYSGSYPAARFRFGMYDGPRLVGVAVFSHPAHPRCLDFLPGERLASVELGRFVLLDEVPANGETWFLARCFRRLAREGLTGVVSFSDPVARVVAGETIFPGHVGTIYQAHNGVYLGKSKPRTMRLLPDGTCLHPRAIAKLKKRERGHRYVAEKLERHGADFSDGSLAAIESVTQVVRHTGNHKYAWTLNRRDRRHLPKSLTFPKQGAPS